MDIYIYIEIEIEIEIEREREREREKEKRKVERERERHTKQQETLFSEEDACFGSEKDKQVNRNENTKETPKVFSSCHSQFAGS